MNKLIVYSLAGILTIGIMASCGDKSGTNAASPAVSAETEISAAPQATAQPTAHATDQPVTTPQPSQGTFTTGVFLELDTIEDPLFNEEIKNLLNTTLEALANKRRMPSAACSKTVSPRMHLCICSGKIIILIL